MCNIIVKALNHTCYCFKCAIFFIHAYYILVHDHVFWLILPFFFSMCTIHGFFCWVFLDSWLQYFRREFNPIAHSLTYQDSPSMNSLVSCLIKTKTKKNVCRPRVAVKWNTTTSHQGNGSFGIQFIWINQNFLENQDAD